ncbi:uncharacterized protein LOC131858811 [Cryptomeria japonica]|uniref:uncharacterized protein LOC131858811 n=1 Tax=Cryptomeria japonica TaxID=3369 RepID=UPI0027DA19D7|nr:uncharacterized protein LOC131858811 [Cryptomeria japonica]
MFPPVNNISDLAKGKFAIFVLDMVIDHNISLMNITLVGKFMGLKPNIEVVRAFVKRRWTTNGQVLISTLPKGYFTFDFSCKEDIQAIRSGGPWVIGKSSLALKKWTTNLDLSDSILKNVPVWVRHLGLPLEYGNEDVFNGLANSFGELLSIDPTMASRRMLVFARIYVGVYQYANLSSSIEIQSKLGTWVQAIEFESIPFACFKCRKLRHWAKRCPLNVSKEKENPQPKPKKFWKIKNKGDGNGSVTHLNGEKDSKSTIKPLEALDKGNVPNNQVDLENQEPVINMPILDLGDKEQGVISLEDIQI